MKTQAIEDSFRQRFCGMPVFFSRALHPDDLAILWQRNGRQMVTFKNCRTEQERVYDVQERLTANPVI